MAESQLDYKINTGKKSGFFSSLFGKKIEVAVWVKSAKKILEMQRTILEEETRSAKT